MSELKGIERGKSERKEFPLARRPAAKPSGREILPLGDEEPDDLAQRLAAESTELIDKSPLVDELEENKSETVAPHSQNLEQPGRPRLVEGFRKTVKNITSIHPPSIPVGNKARELAEFASETFADVQYSTRRRTNPLPKKIFSEKPASKEKREEEKVPTRLVVDLPLPLVIGPFLDTNQSFDSPVNQERIQFLDLWFAGRIGEPRNIMELVEQGNLIARIGLQKSLTLESETSALESLLEQYSSLAYLTPEDLLDKEKIASIPPDILPTILKLASSVLEQISIRREVSGLSKAYLRPPTIPFPLVDMVYSSTKKTALMNALGFIHAHTGRIILDEEEAERYNDDLESSQNFPPAQRLNIRVGRCRFSDRWKGDSRILPPVVSMFKDAGTESLSWLLGFPPDRIKQDIIDSNSAIFAGFGEPVPKTASKEPMFDIPSLVELDQETLDSLTPEEAQLYFFEAARRSADFYSLVLPQMTAYFVENNFATCDYPRFSEELVKWFSENVVTLDVLPRSFVGRVANFMKRYKKGIDYSYVDKDNDPSLYAYQLNGLLHQLLFKEHYSFMTNREEIIQLTRLINPRYSSTTVGMYPTITDILIKKLRERGFIEEADDGRLYYTRQAPVYIQAEQLAELLEVPEENKKVFMKEIYDNSGKKPFRKKHSLRLRRYTLWKESRGLFERVSERYQDLENLLYLLPPAQVRGSLSEHARILTGKGIEERWIIGRRIDAKATMSGAEQAAVAYKLLADSEFNPGSFTEFKEHINRVRTAKADIHNKYYGMNQENLVRILNKKEEELAELDELIVEIENPEWRATGFHPERLEHKEAVRYEQWIDLNKQRREINRENKEIRDAIAGGEKQKVKVSYPSLLVRDICTVWVRPFLAAMTISFYNEGTEELAAQVIFELQRAIKRIDAVARSEECQWVEVDEILDDVIGAVKKYHDGLETRGEKSGESEGKREIPREFILETGVIQPEDLRVGEEQIEERSKAEKGFGGRAAENPDWRSLTKRLSGDELRNILKDILTSGDPGYSIDELRDFKRALQQANQSERGGVSTQSRRILEKFGLKEQDLPPYDAVIDLIDEIIRERNR